jgi:hypothetical protein
MQVVVVVQCMLAEPAVQEVVQLVVQGQVQVGAMVVMELLIPEVVAVVPVVVVLVEQVAQE